MIKRLAIISVLLLQPLTANALDISNIQVSGSGSIDALPDYINIEISIEKSAKQKSEAKKQADQITQQVLDVANQFDIADKHIKAAQLFIYPEYRWHDQTRTHLGERANRTVSIKLYAIEDYSRLAEQLVKLDITRMQQQGFGYDSIDQHRNKALIKALQNARSKAQAIAEEIDRDLDEVFQVIESAPQSRPVYRSANMEMMAQSADSPSAPLDIKPETITANVHVIYTLD